MLFFVGFVIFPVIMAAYYGFFNWHGYGPATDFIGLKNYVTILTDPDFQEAFGHNVFIMVMSIVIQLPVALLLALLLNRKMRGQSLIRVLIFVPYVIAEVVVGTGFSLMLATNGALNGVLDNLGLSGLTRATGLSRRKAATHPAAGSTSTSSAFANSVSGMAKIAPMGPMSQVPNKRATKVTVTDSPTESPTKRGWMIDCTMRFSTQ